MEKIRIACCGCWHSHAKDFTETRAKWHCSDLPYEFAAVWDHDVPRGRQWAQEVGVPFVEDYDALCADPNIDGFIITASLTRKADLMIRAANAGKHIFIEKALVALPEEAYKVRDAIQKSGIHFTMSDPSLTPPIMLAKKLIQEGVLGDIVGMRTRDLHFYGLTNPEIMDRYYDKSESAGGVMYDMGTHGLHIIYCILGKPKQAIGMFSRYTEKGKANDVDDYGVAIFKYAGGQLAHVESGWLCPGGQGGFEIYGTKGFIRNDCDGFRYRVGSWTFATKRSLGDWVWVKPEDMPKEGIPAYPLRYWMQSILNDTPNEEYGIDEAVVLTEMAYAAYQSDGLAVDL